jgi:RNA polymerase sigma factor (sigma-70 family)
MADDSRPSPDHAAGEGPPADEIAGAPGRASRRERLAQLVLRRSQLTEIEATLLWEEYPTLYAAHHARVFNQLRARGVDRTTVEDLVQETFATLFKEIVAGGFPDSLPSFIYKIAQGKLLNYLRDRRRSPLSYGLPSSGSEPPQSPPHLERALDLAALAHQARPELSDAQWAVVDLVIMTGCGYEEAAADLGISLGVLRHRLEAAKTILYKTAKRILPPSQR